MTAKTQDIPDSIDRSAAAATSRGAAPSVPAWATELAGASAKEFALTSVRVINAVSMDAATLEARVAKAYGQIAAGLRKSVIRHPVRLWNYIPSINADMGGGRDRYMVFNAGRYRAFAEWYGGDGAF